jgi:hypothetical protein
VLSSILLADSMPSTTTLLDLSDECLLLVVEACGPLEWVQLAATCKRLRALVLMEPLWRGLLHVQAGNPFKSMALMRWAEWVVGVQLPVCTSLLPTSVVARWSPREVKWVYRVPDEEELQ